MNLTYKDIRLVRIANGITQKDFAEYMGIPLGTWSNVELGNIQLYRDVRAKAIQALKGLGCDFSVIDEEVEFPKWSHAVKREKVVEEVEEVEEVIVEGVSKDEPIVINEDGGGQSRTLY